MDWHLPDDEATTIAGLVIHEAQIIPEAGQAFTFHGFRFEVVRKRRNQLVSIRVTPLADRQKLERNAGAQIRSPGARATMASACTGPASSSASTALIMRWRSMRLLPAKAARHDMELEMGLAGRPRAGMAGMQMRLILERQFRIGECPCEFRQNALTDCSERHVAALLLIHIFFVNLRPSSACGIGRPPP